MTAGLAPRLRVRRAALGCCSPFDAPSSLLMTLLRMPQATIEARCSAGSLRLARLLGTGCLERAPERVGRILKLATPDVSRSCALVKMLIEEHGGALTLTGALGTGTTLSFCTPSCRLKQSALLWSSA
jgi:hypothetical protein